MANDKGNKIAPFSGDRSQSDAFISEIRNFFQLNKANYTDEDDKIAFFFTCFERGTTGGQWAKNALKAHHDEQDNNVAAARCEWNTHAKCVAAFKKTFAAIDPETVARNDIAKLKQTGDYADFEKFLLQFQTLALQTGYNNEALVHFFKEGARPSSVRKASDQWPPPKTLPEWIERVTTLENSRSKNPVPFFESRSSNTTRSSNTSQNMGVPMDIDASRRTTGANSYYQGLPRLTEAERERLRQARACFRCRKPGHMSRECPGSDSSRSGSSTSTSSSAPTPRVRSAEPAPAGTSIIPTPTDTQPAGGRDMIKTISQTFNDVKKLDDDARAEAIAYLKDLMAKDTDF